MIDSAVPKPIARDALAALSVPVFLAGIDAGNPATITLHVARNHRRRGLGAEATAALAHAGVAARCRVRTLKNRRLERARSLEAVLRTFAHDAIVYDPTASVGRGEALLRCGVALREALNGQVAGLYFDPQSRTVFIVLRAGAHDQPLDAERRCRIEARTASALEVWRAADRGAFDLSFRLCAYLPPLALVPLDDASPAERRDGLRSRLHSGLVAGGIATLLGMLAPGQSFADGPAVSAVNAKASLEGGEMNAHPTGVAEGSLAFPLGYSFGGQVDAAGGDNNGQGLWGIAGQGFWRDPGIGLLGATALHSDRGISSTLSKGVYVNRFGGEGAAYLGQFTPEAGVGYQNGNAKSGGFAVLDLGWYPLDDLRLTGGVDINPSRTHALLGGEYQLGLAALPGLAVFVESGISGHRDSYALTGFRIYFGPAKTLIRRHREDDPESPIIGGMSSGLHNTVGNY
jgi:hypothetical protein